MPFEIYLKHYEQSELKRKIEFAKNLINNYNLPLTSEEILKVFEMAILDIKDGASFGESYEKSDFLFDTLLLDNKDMFIALIKAYNYSDVFIYSENWPISLFVISNGNTFKIGSMFDSNNDKTIKAYTILLDYGNFDIDDLKLSKDCRIKINKYREEKYGGRVTKFVNKDKQKKMK